MEFKRKRSFKQGSHRQAGRQASGQRLKNKETRQRQRARDKFYWAMNEQNLRFGNGNAVRHGRPQQSASNCNQSQRNKIQKQEHNHAHAPHGGQLQLASFLTLLLLLLLLFLLFTFIHQCPMCDVPPSSVGRKVDELQCEQTAIAIAVDRERAYRSCLSAERYRQRVPWYLKIRSF